MVQRPHFLDIEDDVRLRDERLAIGSDEALILHDVGQFPPVVAGFPLTLANQSSHRRCWATLVFTTERILIGPMTCLGAVCPNLAVYRVHDSIFTDHAGNHTRPAAVRIDIPDILFFNGLVPIGLLHSSLTLPPPD